MRADTRLVILQVNHVVKQWYRYLESLDALGSDLGPTHGGQVAVLHFASLSRRHAFIRRQLLSAGYSSHRY